MGKLVYFDNASTTRLKPKVLEAMLPYMEDEFANPSGSYDIAQKVEQDIAKARQVLADCIGASPDEIFFTSGGTESDNWAIKGTVLANKGWFTPQVLTSNIEHHAVLNACKDLSDWGMAKIQYAKTDKNGIVDVDDLENKINSNTKIVSVMAANNETGTIQSYQVISKICKRYQVPFHVDAVQAFGKLPLHVRELGIDMMSVSAHKFGGPRGIGFLYINRDLKIAPLLHGGQQEKGLRGGTEYTAGIIGMAKAATIALANAEEYGNHEKNLKYVLYQKITEKCSDVYINGHDIISLPNIINLNFSEYNIRGEELLAFLDENGICASSGSACNSQSDEPSHVLTAMGLSRKSVESSIRFSFNEDNTLDEVEYVAQVVCQGVDLLKS